MKDSEIQSRRDLWLAAYALLCLLILALGILVLAEAFRPFTSSYHLLYLPFAVFVAWAWHLITFPSPRVGPSG